MASLPSSVSQFGSLTLDAVKQLLIPQAVTIASSTAAIDPHTVNWYAFTRAGIVAATIAAPTPGGPGSNPPVPGGDDGVTIRFTSSSAFAHTITFTGSTLDTGSSAVLTATFSPNKGATIEVRAYNGRWQVTDANGVAFS